MELKPMMRSCVSQLDSIVLCPSVTMGLSSFNKKTGARSGHKSISLSTNATLLQTLMFFLGLMMALHVLICLFRMKERRKIRSFMKKRRKRR